MGPMGTRHSAHGPQGMAPTRCPHTARPPMRRRGRRGRVARWALLVLLLAAGVGTLPGGVARAAGSVTSCADDGTPGTLRQVIANAAAGDTIGFARDCTDTNTITLTGLIDLNRNLTIDATASTPAHAVTISGGNSTTLFRSVATVSLRGLTLVNAVNNNFGGGAIENTGTLTLRDCVFSGNSTPAGTGNYYNSGGAIYNQGTLNVIGSTFVNNTTVSGDGGAIYNLYGTLIVVNSTFSGNSAPAGHGGAIFNTDANTGYGDSVNVTGSTFSGNSAPNGQGGGLDNDAGSAGTGPLTLTLTLAVGNSGGDVGGAPAYINNGGNLIGGTVAAAGLGPLGTYGATNGGQTFALLPAAPAINIAACPTDPTTGVTIASDGRGYARPRPVGGRCDAGAFESRGFALSASTGSGARAIIGAQYAAPLTATVTANDPGAPTTGAVVVFTIPTGSGGRAVFGAVGVTGCTASATVASCPVNAGGVATSPPLIANGTPGAFSVTTSAVGVTGTQTYSLTNLPPLALAPGSLPATGVGSPYAHILAVTGGTGAGYTYTVTGGALPAGLTLTSGGVFTGVTTTAGNNTFTVRVTDGDGNSTTAMYTLVIAVPNATPQAEPTRMVMGATPAAALPTHTPGAATGAGTPTPLPQPTRH